MTEYRVPKTGYYRTAAKLYKCIPTGRMETVRNPKYRWYKPWLPKTITRPEYKMSETWEGQEIRLLKSGEIVKGFPEWIGN
jgi:hypothetical protein